MNNKLIKIFINIILPFILSFLVYQFFFSNTSSSLKFESDAKVESEFIQSKSELYLFKQNTTFKPYYIDARALVLDKYFEKNNSPLFGYGAKFVESCDKYKAPYDCTFLPAIAYVETQLCTKGISLKQNNCWGWGGSGENRIIFSSLDSAIETITRGMVNGYGSNNLNYPERYVNIYCGVNCNQYWASSMTRERNNILNIARDLNLKILFYE